MTAAVHAGAAPRGRSDVRGLVWERGDGPRRALQIALGTVWLLDAALQYQPYMFGHGLADQIVAPTGPGSPGWVSGPVSWSAHLIDHAPALFNTLFATVQLLIAGGLLLRRTVRPALLGSFVWAVLLWWLAEGLGGVLAGPVAPLDGLPGAAAIYAVLSVALWPGRRGNGRSVAERSPLRRVPAGLIWLALWGSFVFEALRPADRSPSALHDLVAGNEDGEAGWVKAVLRAGASPLAHHGTEVSIASAVLFAVVAIGGLLPRGRRPALLLAIGLAALIWAFGEAFGEIATGEATDPNSGPLLALLALSMWPTADRGGAPLAEPERPVQAPVSRPRPTPGPRPTTPRVALVAVLAALGVVAVAGCGGSAAGFAGTEITPPFTVPAGSFTDTAGASYDLADRVEGRVTVLYFGYTHCSDVCPTTMADLGIALRSLPVKTASDVQVVFVTSDPARDTPPVIQSWLEHFDMGVAHPFVGLRASQTFVDAYGAKLGIALSPPTTGSDGTEEVTHSAEALAFSADGQAHLVWTPGTTPQQYAKDLAKLVAGRT